MPAVSVVIPTWNGLDLLEEFLPSVLEASSCYARNSLNPVQILIVDDASVDQTGEWLATQGFRPAQARLPSAADPKAPVELNFIKNEGNAGFGASCNRGFHQAAHDLVLLINNDVKINHDAIAPLAKHFNEPQVFAVHCRVFDMQNHRLVGSGKLASFSRGFIRVHPSYVPSNRSGACSVQPLYSAFAGGGAAMFDRKKFEQLGGFEHLLSPYYWEDVELSYRAWKRGYEVLFEPAATATHRVSSTIRKLDQRAVSIIQQRNRLIFHWVHLHDPILLASHLLWLALLVLTAPVRLQPWFLVSCTKAVKMLPAVLARRREERQAARLTDRALFDVFDQLRKDPAIFPYDHYQQLADSVFARP